MTLVVTGCSILPVHGNSNQSEDRGRNRDALDHPAHLAHQAPKGPPCKETGILELLPSHCRTLLKIIHSHLPFPEYNYRLMGWFGWKGRSWSSSHGKEHHATGRDTFH